ncbi:hypothetical protein M378DRAFT_166781 [Amanita muscaria Koide BX008]|uniref:Uncharacterized protein n=1 Tax=Amanita muscaria (strain Koide BX008) TaxID=946122 RepID=A0A0C2T4R0_AMAMK|nr:hypothetical protein M378DRAFT_166781 [Amanita muscaria Koide BX008]
MRSSMKVLFTQDSNGLSSMPCSMNRPEMRVNAVVTNSPEKKYNPLFRNPASDKNQLLPLGNIGRSSNRGLGLLLPPPVSLQLGQDQGTTDFSVPLDVADRASDLNGWSPVFCQPLETPFLDPLNFDDDISPILPLPPSIDSVGSPVQCPNSRPLTVDSAPLATDDLDQVETQDITSVMLNDDLFVQEDVKVILSSPAPDTPTVDIAEYGMSSCYRSDKATFVGEPSPDKRSPLLCDNVRLPIILPAIPIYYGRSRDDNFGPSTPPSHDGTRTRLLSSHAVVRSSVTCGHRRSYRIRQSIETSSPSMTPSPTNSPKLYRLPIHRTEGDCEAQSPKGLSLEPAVSDAPTKKSSHQPSVLCAQLPKRRSNVHESIRTNTRCSPWNSPIFRSPLALGFPSGALSQQMTESDSATLRLFMSE